MAIKSHQFILFIIVPVLLLSPATAQPSPPDSSAFGYGYSTNINSSVGIIIIVIVASLFLLAFFSMYIRHCSPDSSSDAALRLSANQPNRSRTAPRGLETSVIESFPTFDYSSVKSLHIGKGALECAVCLNEFEDHETLRLIPKCDHVFHPDCIDTWLISHTTCPVCRAELTPQPGESLHAPNLGQIPEAPIAADDSVIHVACETEATDWPLNPVELPTLNRSRTRGHASGRPRWLAVFARSNSTGHVALRQQGESNNNVERFTLRLPEDVRRQIMSGQLSRTTSCVALPREGSSRRGYRAGLSGPSREGSSRGRMLGSWAGRSDRWGFSMAPPFFTRGPSVRSPKVAAAGGGDDGSSVHSSKAGDSVRGSTNLPPV